MPRSRLLTIEAVRCDSPADRAGLQPGDALVDIDGHPVRDVIDYQFWMEDGLDAVTIQRDDRVLHYSIDLDDDDDPGLVFAPIQWRACGNRCIFCFVDQNPPGLRKSLYFKDEDFRLSFLFGNYVTLTHAGQEDLERIAEQRLSPLYVSVHATDPDVRRRMLGLSSEDGLTDKIRFLTDRGVTLHCQVVLCPGINDGQVLKQTLKDLSGLFPHVRSVSVVPVGLTRHREGLPKLKNYDASVSDQLMKDIISIQKNFEKQLGESFVYLADEFYLLAGVPIPHEEHYGDFWQLDNGVGMTSDFLSDFKSSHSFFPEALDAPREIVLVTGQLAGPVLERDIVPILNRIGNLSVRVHTVVNRFFGTSITVSGLLTGGDILDSLSTFKGDANIILPSNCLNADGLFLDGLTPNHLSDKLGCPVIVFEDWPSLWEGMA